MNNPAQIDFICISILKVRILKIMGEKILSTDTIHKEKAIEAWNLLQKVNQIIHRVLQKKFYSQGITPSQFEVLAELRKHEELPMWKISKSLAVTGGNVTGLIDRMEKKGLVARERSEKDRRIVNARITGYGEKTYQKVVGEFEMNLLKILSSLENRELNEFDSMLQKLYERLREKY